MINSNFKAHLITIVITAVIFIYCPGTALFAQPHDNGPGNHKGPGDNKGPAERLKFDDEQKEELKKLGEEHMEKMKSIEKADHKLHDELFSLLKEDSPDKTKADSLISLIAENRKKADAEIFSHFSDIKNLCKTDEQKKLFGEFVDDIGKMPPGPHQMQPPPPPPIK